MQAIIFDLNDKENDNKISNKLEELKSSGQVKLNLEIKNSFGKLSQKFDLDIDTFSKIKEIQDLPDWVIIKLLLVEGCLAGSDLKERILNE